MAASMSILSQTLQSITKTKIEELISQRKSFENVKGKLLGSVRPEDHDVRTRVARLHDGVEKLELWSWSALNNIRRWLAQSRYDSTVTDSMLLKFEDQLRSKLDQQSRKLNLAYLYSQLLIEWTDASEEELVPELSKFEKPTHDDDFNVVHDFQNERFQQLRESFENVVFEPLDTNEEKITKHLSSLFADDHGKKRLETLRAHISANGRMLLGNRRPIKLGELKLCIKSLLKNDLLQEETAATLRNFLRDDTVLEEIRDVLNMRYANLDKWSWNLGSRGMPVRPRQSLNGKWRVVIDEDVLQTLLVHYIGHKWASPVKHALKGALHTPRDQVNIPREQLNRRYYYLGDHALDPQFTFNVEHHRRSDFQQHFFLSTLPSKPFGDAAYDDDEVAEDSDDEEEADKLSPVGVKQLLIRTLATEVLVKKSIEGEVAVIQSDFQWFGTGLTHTSIFACLRFLGFQEEWVTFFEKAIQPPLDMMNGGPVRKRARGLPMGHILAKLLGEVVLFFMDLAVEKDANMLLYRFHDDFWLCGKSEQCADAWTAMQKFADVIGLVFNKRKTGSVYLVDTKVKKIQPEIMKKLPDGPVTINFLTLDPGTGKWIVNKDHVKQHVMQLKKQLDECKSVLAWVETWNSCIGRFFSYTFGEPANCFGREHLDSVLETHKYIQCLIFDGKNGNGLNATDHIFQMISKRFDVHGIPHGFLYLPEAFGGLGLVNPFIPLTLVDDGVCDDPVERIHAFLENERTFYETAKREFEGLSEFERRQRFRKSFPLDEEAKHSSLSWDDAQHFFSFEEYFKWYEKPHVQFYNLYTYLLEAAVKEELDFLPHVKAALLDLARTRKQPEMSPVNMSLEVKWAVQLYADELFEKCGGLSIVDKSLLPLGVLKAMRSRRVKWQMSL
ncbi:uncharacterized protein GIQ15_01935 [Arthroderma uncinatum]|uniref:uncharacterized protein n=1 Tax=Arthroderma uncinatum TaxID=74035 RepID=UPI00144AF0FC|nr:uncharacterized protein GIQ15_01935 [Arthroderma uncinatum]KAF3492418.1 hypothetical protein GIQ15_01935 [Arthroderma uncinatum]